MGTRGSKVQKICSDFDVQIKIPDRANKENNGIAANGDEHHSVVPEIGAAPVNNDIIRITGRSDNCEAAKEALINLVPINIEVILTVLLVLVLRSVFSKVSEVWSLV